ncbi:hypothetical protein EVAR_101059_1 [Eumeta japonica]|uniref:Uncharacterized protein n=1 Tax=Eumeta variegata TaxID=151549 RepID=A0A4C2AD05_EUMVA|nr:hypothetical protein EVAR_101059_1 [Eumeta japonica]
MMMMMMIKEHGKAVYLVKGRDSVARAPCHGDVRAVRGHAQRLRQLDGGSLLLCTLCSRLVDPTYRFKDVGNKRLMMELEGGHRNSVIKRRNPIEFGLVEVILLWCVWMRVNLSCAHKRHDEVSRRSSSPMIFRSIEETLLDWVGLRYLVEGGLMEGIEHPMEDEYANAIGSRVVEGYWHDGGESELMEEGMR